MSDVGTVIVGGGQAGVQAALSLRELGYAKPVTILGDEPHPPYQRPPLSKAFMMGKVGAEGLYLRAPDFFERAGVSLVAGRAHAIDRGVRKVFTDRGEVIRYEALILATGGRNRVLDIPGADLDGVFSLRSLQDASAMRERLASVRDAVVIGGGFIGLEFAAVAAKSGARVHVVEAGPRPMARAVSPEVSSYFTQRHSDRGTSFSFDDTAIRIHGEGGRVASVETAKQGVLRADLVLIGVGIIPNAELAQAAGLATDNGIVVDEHLVTSDPLISAIGDCAVFPNVFSKRTQRVESVQNAVDQGRAVAARLMGKPSPYGAVPWFWSDQGEDKLQIAGISLADDSRLAKGDEAAGRFSVFRFRGDELVCVESVNRAADHMAARNLLKSGRLAGISPAAVRSENFELKTYAAKETANA